MSEHLQFEENLELYALGALDADERIAFATHLATCPACKARLAETTQWIGLLGSAVPQTAPAHHVKQSLMARLHQDVPQERVVAPAPKRVSFWSFCQQPIFAWGCAAVLAVVALVFAGEARQLHHRLDSLRAELQTQQAAIATDRKVVDLLNSPQTQRVALKQPTDASRPEGKVYYQPKQGLLFYATNLPAASSDHVYQLWLVPTEGAPISAGIFHPNAKGEASVVLPQLPSGATAKAFAVTLEPAGGVPQPTGPKVLLGLV